MIHFTIYFVTGGGLFCARTSRGMRDNQGVEGNSGVMLGLWNEKKPPPPPALSNVTPDMEFIDSLCPCKAILVGDGAPGGAGEFFWGRGQTVHVEDEVV